MKKKKKKRPLARLIATIRRKFWTSCPRCHHKFGGHEKYQENVKIEHKHYRIVCHTCAKSVDHT